MRWSCFALPFLSGCFGVYAEVATTTLPSASIDASTKAGATSVGFNIGADFGSSRMRFALGYASDKTTFEGGSAQLGTSSSRFDFTVLSLGERARIRLGAGFATGTGKSTVGSVTKNSDGGGAFAGLDVTYFLTWKLGVHAFGGPIYMSQSVPGGTLGGTGVTFRLALSYTFGDIRPDTDVFIPLENRDLTGILEEGANSIGCSSSRDSNPSSGYAFLHVRCSGREVLYMQVAQGINARCFHMFDRECDAFTARLGEASAAALKGPATAAPPAPTPPAPTTAAPTPAAPTPVPATEPVHAPATEPAVPAPTP
jgi:hypothetical protein